jgi:hypothetical protein
MIRVLLVFAIAIALSACASRAPQPSAAPSAVMFPAPPPVSGAEAATMGTTQATATWAMTSPRLSPRADCFVSGGVWRATAYVCEYEVE